ncbi:MAG: DNA glycosylase AlkZ-like family protein [Ruthenibacterium lactatiformans]
MARLLARTGAAALEQRGAGAGAGICGGQSALVPFCRPRCAGPSLRPAGAAAPARRDPYLDTRDRDVLLPDKALQKLVWRTVGNPGAVVLDGRISGVWTARTVRDRLELSVTAWQAFSARQQSMLEIRAQEYAAFRGLSLLKYTLEDG